MNQPLCPTEFQNENNRKLSRNDLISKKNKTIKKRRKERVSSENNRKYNIKNLMANMNDGESDSEDELGDYKQLLPPPTLQHNSKPASPSQYNPNVVANKLVQSNTPNVSQTSGENDEAITKDGFTMLQTNDGVGYDNYVPYYTNAGNNQSLDGPKDKLLEKLNYMIHLLEEQKEEKTGHVAEELILYSFLGVFVIYVVDSFARVGKYVR